MRRGVSFPICICAVMIPNSLRFRGGVFASKPGLVPLKSTKPKQKKVGFRDQRIVVLPRKLVKDTLSHPLLKSLMATDVGYFPKAKGHFRIRESGAEEAIFMYCANGAGGCDLEGRTYQINKGHLLVIPAGVPHSYWADKEQPWSIHWFHVVGTNVGDYLDALGLSAASPVLPFPDDVQLLSLFEEVLEAAERGFTLKNMLYTAHTLSHLMGWLLWHADELVQSKSNARTRVNTTIEFLKSHIREPLRMKSLASMAFLSVSQYNNLFRSITGYSPANYFTRLRMQRAVELLNFTTLSIKEISALLGYCDQFYFSRVFHATYEHTPTEHRALFTPNQTVES